MLFFHKVLLAKTLPVAYANRTLNKAEENYSTVEKELLAIVWAVHHFRPYIYGYQFNIVTDHKPLTWLLNLKDPGSRLMRWRIKLEEYNYDIIYEKGSCNTNADALSRIYNITVDNYFTFKEAFTSNLILNTTIIENSKDSFIFDQRSIVIDVPRNFQSTNILFSKIKEKFNKINELISQNKGVGEVAHIKHDDIFIFYLITRSTEMDLTSNEILFKTLINLRNLVLPLDIKELSFPPIINQTDNLDSSEIRAMLRYIFKNSDKNLFT